MNEHAESVFDEPFGIAASEFSHDKSPFLTGSVATIQFNMKNSSVRPFKITQIL